MEITTTTLIGLMAATCTTIAFLPQVYKTWKARTAKDLSLGMFSIFAVGITLWFIYGVLINDLPVILANAVTLLLVCVLLYFKLTMDRPPR
jgi:MtN3 and saliva related transmembrane protein